MSEDVLAETFTTPTRSDLNKYIVGRPIAGHTSIKVKVKADQDVNILLRETTNPASEKMRVRISEFNERGFFYSCRLCPQGEKTYNGNLRLSG